MKRKTNLFYTKGNDSKFITFSNYTESLTGNFLSTDTKLFPSRFLCLKIPALNCIDENGNYTNKINEKKKEQFIKYLVSYYESKLAVLRDNAIENNESIENSILPLNYLLESLMYITNINEDSIEIDQNNNKYIFELSYISDITEQDYNGTYTDTICIVDMQNIITGKIIKKTEEYDKLYSTIHIPLYDGTTKQCLYGWEDGTLSNYEDEQSIFDIEDED